MSDDLAAVIRDALRAYYEESNYRKAANETHRILTAGLSKGNE